MLPFNHLENVLPTILDIAVRAGVSTATVSLSLRNHPRISIETRRRIQSLAQQLGYEASPLKKALVYYRSKATHDCFGRIAWINPADDCNDLRSLIFDEYFSGALQRAKELGFKLQKISLSDLGENSETTSKKLLERGFEGLIIVPHPRKEIELNLDWDRFFAISIGCPLAHPTLDMVGNHQYRATHIALQNLRLLGYERIGFVSGEIMQNQPEVTLGSSGSEQGKNYYLAAFLAEQQKWPPRTRVPYFSVHEGTNQFSKWLKRHKPDTLLAVDTQVLGWLKRFLKKIPQDMGFATPCLKSGERNISGVNQHHHRVGRTAVEYLMQFFQHDEKGVPSYPASYLIEGTWHSGTTVKKIKGPTHP